MTKAHRLKIRQPRTAGSSPQSLGARQREAMAKQQHKGLGLTVPINFLLGCSNLELGNYELQRLANVGDLRAHMHVLLDQTIDEQALAYIAAWFRSMDRSALKHAIENEEDPLAWARRMIAEGQRSEEENQSIPRPPLPPGAAHLAAALRYQQRNIAQGLCAICPQPLDGNSVQFCTKHLALSRHRAARKRGVKGEPGSADYLYGEITESTHGRQRGSLAALEMNREKKTRAVLAEMGIPPEKAAVSLMAARKALLESMPDSKADAMTQEELCAKALIPSPTTLQRALRALHAEERIERIGKGVNHDPFRYWLTAKPKPALPGKVKNQVLLQTLRGEPEK